MNSSQKSAYFALILGLGLPSVAFAQVQMKPNILLLVDTSGSMEYKTGTNDYPACYPTEADPNDHEKSRWINVLEVLTGTISNYSCAAEERDAADFIDEFQMPNGVDPPDAYYRNPYHRPLSSGCAITPANPPAALTNAFDWDPPTQATYPVNPSLLVACGTAFNQAATGFLDSYGDLARFGLMTFDPLPDENVGHTASTPWAPDYTNGAAGAWSYYVDGANLESRPAEGRPADCATSEFLEVGVRNGAAPVSEGKMIYFGNQDLPTSKDDARHDRLQQVLLATRPYGATPLNGALDDARAFFWYDDAVEPTTATGSPLYGTPSDGTMLSPRYDQYVSCGCREQHIILITDGEPNLDLRPECDEISVDPGLPGDCPYNQTPEQILADLSGKGTDPLSCSPLNPDNQYRILTHVVGFSTATYDLGAGVANCEDLPVDYPTWADAGGICDGATNEDLKVCCTLHELAEAGGTVSPFIAPDADSLGSALSEIMRSIVPTTQSRTQPVRSPGVGDADSTGAVAFRLLTSYTPISSGGTNVWKGNLERLRWSCASGAPVEQDKEVTEGDDFNVNVANDVDSRTFVTLQPEGSAPFNARDSLRPFIATADDEGVGERGGTGVSAARTGLSSALDSAVLELDYTTDAACTGTTSNDACRDRILNWTLGGVDDLGNTRCATPGDETCSVLGDIMHSTPAIVNRPSGVVEDESYDTFAAANSGRMMMAYTASNDGMLHGFALSPNASGDPSVDTDSENNETFAFLPPAVLPLLKEQYPATRLQLLDGIPVTLDVVATASLTYPAYPFKLERSLGTAQAGTNVWRTVLVQAFGGDQPGYFAIDITDPEAPVFLWQLTTTSSGNNLFGSGGTPLITTLNVDGSEVAVAVLPGGTGDSPLGGSCARHNTTIGGLNTDTHFDATITAGYDIRPEVSCYADTASLRAARSLTVVRLDSGEILRRFAYEGAAGAEFAKTPDVDLDADVFALTTENPLLDSPISGAPSAFPAGPGMISDRVFVGDQDGTLWRVDVSKPDPQDWTMQLFFDAYTGEGATDGKPIVVAPALSIDEAGQITIAIGTGDQDLTGATGDKQYFYSLTEAENFGGDDFAAQVNWFRAWTDGSHLLGPINLLGGVLYFSTVSPIANVCNEPGSTIWGMHYINPFDASDLSDGGAAGLAVQGSSAIQSDAARNLVNGGAGSASEVLVFGLSLEYVPSCTDAPEPSTDYFGNSRSKVKNPTASNLQLVFQTAGGDTSKADLGFTTGFEAITLEPPPTASTILSWASLLD